MLNIHSFIENKYEQFYYIIKSTQSLVIENENLYLCYDKIHKINDINNYIKSKKSININNIPDIFKEYIIAHYDKYEIGIIINNNELKEIYL